MQKAQDSLKPWLDRAKKIIPYVKLIGLLLSFIFIYILVREQMDALDGTWSVSIDLKFIAAAAGSCLLILAGNAFNSLALGKVFDILQVDVDLMDVFRANLKSQIGKYIPGGIFQVSGAAALLMESAPAKDVVIGLAAQPIFLIALSGVLGLPLLVSSFHPLLLILPGLALLTAGTVFALRLGAKRIRYLEKVAGGGNLVRELAAAVIYGLLFFAAIGFSFYILMVLLFNGQAIPAYEVVLVFAISWSAGMIIIGSPGGLGVREILIASMLGVAASNPDVGLLLVIHRILWVTADVLLVLVPYRGIKRLLSGDIPPGEVEKSS